jgi:hypothetical protein
MTGLSVWPSCWNTVSPQKYWKYGFSTHRSHSVSLRQDGLDYFDTLHTSDDTLDKTDPKQLD